MPLVADSGNNILIVPDYDAIPNTAAYQTLTRDPVKEPWNCDAHIVQGPINIPTRAHGVLRIPDCIFYACMADNPDGTSGRTSNFGFGYTTSWAVDPASNQILKVLFAYLPQPPLVEVDIRPATGNASNLAITEDSSLILLDAQPTGYTMFSLASSTTWMSLVPEALSIAGTRTSWPGTLNPVIAMIDTGGTAAFLSDPNGALSGPTLPDTVPSPFNDKGRYDKGIATEAVVEIVLGDGGGTSYSFSLSTAALPPAAQGPLLVICRNCEFMFGVNGILAASRC